MGNLADAAGASRIDSCVSLSHRYRVVESKSTTIDRECSSLAQRCVACGAESCTVTAHRLATLRFWRQTSKKHAKKGDTKRATKQKHSKQKDSNPERASHSSKSPDTDGGLNANAGREDTAVQVGAVLDRGRPCGVCGRWSCVLGTHRQYEILRTANTTSSPDAKDKVRLDTFNGSPEKAQTLRSQSLPSSLSDPSLQLPGQANKTALRQLFYDFFTIKSQHLTSKRSSKFSFARDYQDFYLAQALDDDALCMATISLSAAFSADQQSASNIIALPENVKVFSQMCRLISRAIKKQPTEST